ncbi:MAG: PD-(D/E)XK nuclease family protein [Eubacterium sp.]|nr:PD-(D/E)XK nuclease family protein [Eubacterium sp.]
MLNIYYGRESINKEKFVYSRIAARGYSAARPVLVIVPDQYTLEAERQAFRFLEADSLIGLDVFSMSRLGHNILKELGGDRKAFIDKYGRQMLLTRICREEDENLTVFQGNMAKTPFVELTNDFISELKQYGVTPEDLAAAADAVPASELLHRKLTDLTRIYTRYQQEIEGKYTDSEDYIDLYIERIADSRYVRGASVWVYGFDSLAPKALKVLGGLMAAAEEVNVVLTIDRNCRDEAIFGLTDTVAGLLVQTARDVGCEIGERAAIARLPEAAGAALAVAKAAPELAVIEQELFAAPVHPYREAPTAITVCEAANIYNEAESAAAFILHLLRDCGYRRRDIVVVCNDQKLRASVASRVFEEYGLPLFHDSKRGILNAGLAVCLISLLTTVVNRYRTEDLLKALKSGFLPLTPEEVERLEIYARQYRIRGTMWKKPLRKGLDEYGEEGFAAMEELRARAVTPFLEVEALAARAENVQMFTVQFYELLTKKLGILERLQSFMEEQQALGLPDLAEETAQIWALVCGILDQIVALTAEEPFDLADFSEMFRVGLSQIEVGVLPSSIDDLMMGTMQRTRAGEIRALVILGANEGVLPSEADTGGLFALEELEALEEAGHLICKSDQVRIAEERLSIYRNMSKPSDALWIGYSVSDEEGKELRRSEIVDSVLSVFPALSVQEDVLNRADRNELVGGRMSTMRHLVDAMRKAKRTRQEDAFWKPVEDWYRDENPEFMKHIDQALAFQNQTDSLPKGEREILFREKDGFDVLSPSRIETYARCPFRYYVQFGLKPAEEREFRADPRAIGDVYHLCLMEAAEILSEENLWQTVSREDLETIVDQALSRIEENYRDGLFSFSGEEKYKIQRIRKTCLGTLWMLVLQARAGHIAESRYEVGFGRGRDIPAIEIPCGDRTVLIEGQIDRLDLLTSGRINILDYKSAENKLNMDEVRAGYRLQLMLYMKAARGETGEPAGVFYFHIQDPRILAAGSGALPEMIEAQLRRRFELKGILVDADTNVEDVCGNFESRSEVTGIRRTKDGTLSGSADCALMTEEEFAELANAVDERLSELAAQMEGGEIPIAPMRSGDRSSCTYCDFRGICRFDQRFEGNRYRYVK